MPLSKPVDWVDKPFEGYVVNAEFSSENAYKISEFTHQIQNEHGGVLFFPPVESLHITLLDWIAPLVDYDGRNKAELYDQIKDEYDTKLTQAMHGVGQIEVIFDEVRVTDTTIILVGRDHGQTQRIRDTFVDSVALLPGTKLPPTIIHTSIARFIKETEAQPIIEFAAENKPSFIQLISNFRLIHSRHEPLIKYDVLKRYPL